MIGTTTHKDFEKSSILIGDDTKTNSAGFFVIVIVIEEIFPILLVILVHCIHSNIMRYNSCYYS